MHLKSCIIMVNFANSLDDSNESKLFVIDTILEKELFIFTSGLDYKEKINKQKQILEDRGVLSKDYDHSEIFAGVEKPILRTIVYNYEEFEEMNENFKNISNNLT